MMLPVIQNNEDSTLCGSCTRRCCESMPGEVLPDQLGNDVESVSLGARALLLTGDYAIDWWEGDPRPGESDDGNGYYLRPRIAASTSIFDPAWENGPCVFLAAKGCRLAFDERPGGCQLLAPLAGTECVSAWASDMGCSNSKQVAATLWWPYSAALISIGQELDRDFDVESEDYLPGMAELLHHGAFGW